ncbi:helix-turn-helix domain-containing protein [Chryseolinea lacunae]|uniref:Helix-turn-helix transcriptional regulator n=1 Tax=Chryseolinea lacunae TaxID=2801331 RepID=A0ABS1L1W4_9BACT|nr:AraC family transcriptional regulator [Chryseolinea lacunae]MBL0745689.1 helix-turn-helix transcriptional regulator [Chryseolinea lacunae]
MVYVKGGSSAIPYIKELPGSGINLVIDLNEKTSNTIFAEHDFSGKHIVKNAWISGVQAKAIYYKNNPESTIVSVRFTMGGFYALSKTPITAIGHVGLDAVSIFGNSFNHLYQKLIEAADVDAVFALIENYFVQYAIEASFESSLVRFIDKNIARPIDWLINKSGYSQKHVISVVKKQTGFSPKYLQRLNRFQNVVNEIQLLRERTDWLTIVQRYGYHDQAHFVKEFAHFTGITPTEYLRSQLEIEGNQLVTDMILSPPTR